ncbi:CatB-related O-acetyltransferase [Methanococcus sp. CF]
MVNMDLNNSISEHVKLYRDVDINCSKLDEYVSIGDLTVITGSHIKSNSMINRRNYILRSIIDSYTYTGIGTIILSSEIGRFCSIGWNVSIGGADHDYKKVTTSPLWRFQLMDNGKLENGIEYSKSPCKIENDVWIGSNAVILRDVHVGNGAVIGAGSVVTHDVEPYSIVAGVPAKPLKNRFKESTISKLQKIQWWNWPKEVIRSNLDIIYSQNVTDDVIYRLNEISNNIKSYDKL